MRREVHGIHRTGRYTNQDWNLEVGVTTADRTEQADLIRPARAATTKDHGEVLRHRRGSKWHDGERLNGAEVAAQDRPDYDFAYVRRVRDGCYSGTTAVASISTLARGSTRPATTTTAITGK